MKERPRKPAGRPGKGQPPALPKQKEQEKGPKPTKNPEGLPGPALRLNQRRLKTALVGDKSSPPKRSRRPLEQPKGTTPQPSPPQKAKPQPAPNSSHNWLMGQARQNYSSSGLSHNPSNSHGIFQRLRRDFGNSSLSRKVPSLSLIKFVMSSIIFCGVPKC